MKNATAWILITLVLIAAFTGLVLLYGAYGFIAGCVLAVIFIFGLDRLHRWRSNRLFRSITPSETLVASGLVSESTYDETPAILVRGDENRYRVHVADSRGSQMVRSVASELTRHTNVYDMKKYIAMYTDQGVVHFAPRKGLIVATQPDYAQEVLTGMLANSVPLKG